MSLSPEQHKPSDKSPSAGYVEHSLTGSMSALTPISSDGTYWQPSQFPLEMMGAGEDCAATEDPSLGSFLRDVLQCDLRDGNLESAPMKPLTDDSQDQYMSKNLMDFSHDFSLDFSDLDEVLRGDWIDWVHPMATGLMPSQFEEGMSDNIASSSVNDSISLGTAAYERSAWQWIPGQGEGSGDYTGLTSVLMDGASQEQLPSLQPHSLVKPLKSKERDCIIALLLAVCEKVSYQKIMTSFPDCQTLNIFLNDFLLTMEHSIDSWIHLPTLSFEDAAPEFLTIVVAGGASLGLTRHAQRFGYALQELARLALPEMFEKDNSKTRNLQALQAFAVCLDIGTWSGNKRAMELAESQVSPLITMLRRSGRFRRPRTALPVPSLHDSAADLQQKWSSWVEAESFKRLAYHVFLYSVQVSVAFQTPPLISYAEITLDLPAPQAVWRAQSAVEWRTQYLLHQSNVALPSFVASMRDPQTMGAVRGSIDLELTLYLVLLSHWCLAWEYMQLSAANKSQASAAADDAHYWAGTFLASSKCAELRKLLDSFHVAIEEWDVVVPKEVHMVSQLLRMNLCVAFEDLQILAGKEGAEEARRVLPVLKQWYYSPECRQAIWHAGQTLRAARRPAWRSLDKASRAPVPNTLWLRDFNAVALYHAGLALWVYGLLSRVAEAEQATGIGNPAHGGGEALEYGSRLVYVDGDENLLLPIERHGFIGLNQGCPVVSANRVDSNNAITTAASSLVSPQSVAGDVLTFGGGERPMIVPLDDPRRVMDVLIQALSPTNFMDAVAGGNDLRPFVPQRPAMVENLIQLLQDLGAAASTI